MKKYLPLFLTFIFITSNVHAADISGDRYNYSEFNNVSISNGFSYTHRIKSPVKFNRFLFNTQDESGQTSTASIDYLTMAGGLIATRSASEGTPYSTKGGLIDLTLSNNSGFTIYVSGNILTYYDSSIDPLEYDPVVWFDASDGSTIAQGTGVSTWSDKSTNGNDLAQVSGTLQPEYATNTLNGLPVITFDGVDDGFNFNSDINISTAYIFLVTKSSGYMLAADDTDRLAIDATDPPKIYWHQNGSTPFNGTQSSIKSPAEWQLNTLIADGSDTYMYIDSSLDISQTYSGAMTFDRLGLKWVTATSISSLSGDIAEVLIFESLTVDEVSEIEQYLTEKWLN